jgi:hypothetical protein
VLTAAAGSFRSGYTVWQAIGFVAGLALLALIGYVVWRLARRDR